MESKVEHAVSYPRIKLVQSFAELVSTPFADGVNALCWQRELQGDFAAVATALPLVPGITNLEKDQLLSLELTEAGKLAVKTMLADLQMLREHDLDPVLDYIHGYVSEPESGPLRTDVCSFHADSATVMADTYLCTYSGACSEGLCNDQAIAHQDVPETRARLLAAYGGADDAGFAEYLEENCYDLHYAALPGAQPFAFGVGHLWRIAIQYPGCPVPPCIHRAPEPLPHSPPRLLLLS
jgi:hypothetical protein